MKISPVFRYSTIFYFMHIYLNSKPVVAEKDLSLLVLLQQNGFANKKGIAVAVNSSVISKSEWGKFALTAEDKVLVISATKGG